MRRFGLVWLFSLSSYLAACKFPELPPLEEDAASIDASAIDVPTGTECVPSTQTCSAGRYTQCDGNGYFVTHAIPNGDFDGSATSIVMNSYQCPMFACHASQPGCADIDASYGLNAALDAAGTDATGVDVILPRSPSVPAGTIRVDTNSYDPGTQETTIVDADSVSVRVPAMVLAQAGGPEILVLKTRTFTVRAGNRVLVRGDRAFAVAAHFDVFIAGTVDLSAFEPGDAWQDFRGPGSSTASACSGVYSQNSAGGGGNVGGGGRPGAGAGTAGGPQSTAFLAGGCDGGMLNIAQPFGGGALQIASRTRVAVAAGALVDVSGGRGVWINPGVGVGALGGGSGGTVIIEAPAIILVSGAVVAGRGGSGSVVDGVNGTGVHGNEGTITGTAGAASVTCSGCGVSGAGGTESTLSGADGAGAGAAGGGSVGRCVTRNHSGVLVPEAGAMKIFHTVSTLAPRSPP